MRIIDMATQLQVKNKISTVLHDLGLYEHHDKIMQTELRIVKNKSYYGMYRPQRRQKRGIRSTRIDINALLLQPQWRADLVDTFLHEVAHYITRLQHGYGKHITSHGWQWKSVMRALGIKNPSACNQHDISGSLEEAMRGEIMVKRSARKIHAIWVCDNCSKEYTILRKRKNPITAYRCNRCKSSLSVKKAA